ncbi:spermidine synthase [Govanella unica]|uniref:MnmC family methyltransferase n=1 Tax=Govanella unica TaxID=2975056 RepID=A0A9X3TVP9_9PROT|nr:MnmC family methyltransferase [Govania unica]MDA5192875.1 MnmC family methyltransferase [Govania unica]
MLPRILIGTAEIPGGADNLRLLQRGAEFSIMLGSTELMNSRVSGSEKALATLSCEKILPRSNPRMLIGGLGMGFTLRAALELLGADATVTVAELVPEVVAWARGPLAHIFGDSLTDPRVTVLVADVVHLISEARSHYDAILLDVDNGPDGLTCESNDQLYNLKGLRLAHAALRPGGVLAVWSSAPDKVFTERLRKAGFEVDEVVVRANEGRNGARHVIWFAVKPGLS